MSLKKKAPKRAAMPDKITPKKVEKTSKMDKSKSVPTPKTVEKPSKKSKMDKSKTVPTPKKEDKRQMIHIPVGRLETPTEHGSPN